MPYRLEFTDLKILEGLGSLGPRNISQLARKLGMPTEMVRRRIKRMQFQKAVSLHANIYHTNLGLRKAVLLADATPGNEALLLNSLKANDFWIYVSRCYGGWEGCLGVYTIPKRNYNDFEEFIATLKELGISKSTRILWSTCFQKVNPTTNWFDSKSQEWIFPWKTWIEEIPGQKTELPYTLKDPKDFPIRGDYTDIFILKEMEKDATIDFKKIADKLGMTLQGVRHHYKEHVIKHNLLENFEIEVLPFSETTSDFYFFIFEFLDMRKMTKFALSLLNKPFVFVLGKVLGRPAMISQLYLPKEEFIRFKDSLSVLIRKGFVKEYDYVILHPGEWSRQTISYEFFQNNAWVYDHDKHIQRLKEMTKNRSP